jgi:hypothetical protein
MLRRLNASVNSTAPETALDDELGQLIEDLEERGEMGCTGNACGANGCGANCFA